MRTSAITSFCLALLLGPCTWTQEAISQSKSNRTENICTDRNDFGPYWGTPSCLYKLNPTADNLKLAEWSQSVEQEISAIVVQQLDWQKHQIGNHCFFFVASDGEIKDPLMSCSDKRSGEKFTRAIIPKLGNFPKPPEYLKGRRIRLILSYPSISIEVDGNDPSKDAEYFEQYREKVTD